MAVAPHTAKMQRRGADPTLETLGGGSLPKADPRLDRDAQPDPGGDPARDRGRSAREPQEIPASGWRDILLRVWDRLGRENVSLLAAGIALNMLLAVFPALAAVVSVWGMFASPADVAREIAPFLQVLPPEAARILQLQLVSLAQPHGGTLGIGAAVTVLLALWNARQGMSALMTASNIAYHERERRGWIRQIALSLLFTVGALVGFVLMILIGVAMPLVLSVIALGSVFTTALLAARWILLWLFGMLALALIYRYAPSRHLARMSWVTWGSAIAASLWIVTSIGFALYVRDFGSYGRTYGALGGVIVLLMWFYLQSFAIILGAEINAEMEHQTAEDTTEGPPVPMGERGAYVADTLGPTPR